MRENKKIRLTCFVDIERSFIYTKFCSALSCCLNILLNIYDYVLDSMCDSKHVFNLVLYINWMGSIFRLNIKMDILSDKIIELTFI